MSRSSPTLDEYVEGIRAFDRTILSKAITLIESRRAEDEALAQELLDRLYADTGEAWRVGITGVPGVGKSTFIEVLGTKLVREGHRVAVLAVDPSSSISGGSILGDKSRLEELAREESAYIRPSPSAETLGGVTHREELTTWPWPLIEERLLDHFRNNEEVRERLAEVERDLVEGRTAPGQAADMLLGPFLSGGR